MKNSTILILILFGLSWNNLFSQDIYKYYSGNLGNVSAGNPNVVYDTETKHYFFVEWVRDITLSRLGAFNIKKVDADGNLISNRYYPTDSHPYSAHFISDIEIQGDDIVLFFNRNIQTQLTSHDFFIVRFDKSLSGTYDSKRYYYPTSNHDYSTIRVMDSKKWERESFSQETSLTQPMMKSQNY